MITPAFLAAARCAAFCLGLTLVAAALAAPAPTSDFVRRAEVARAAISEDGRYVSFLTPSRKDYYDLNAYDTQTKESKRFDLGGDDVMAYQWIDERRMILTTQNRPHYYYRQQVFDVTLGKITGNLSYRLDLGLNGYGDSILEVISSLRRDPNLFVAWFENWDEGRGGLAIINLKAKPGAMIGQDNSRYNVKEWLDVPKGEYHGAIPDAEGEIRFVILYQDKKLRYHYRTGPNSPWTELPFDPENTSVIGYTNDPDLLYITTYSAAAKSSRIHRYRVSTNDPGPALFEEDFYSPSEANLFQVRQADGSLRTLSLGYHRDMYAQRAIDPVFSEIQTALAAKLPGRLNRVADCDRSLRRFVIASSSGREPDRFLVYDRETQAFLPLAAPTPWFKAAEMSVMRPMKFTARDGLVLEGYLSLPAPASDGRKPPLIVYPHGGPWARDVWDFDADTQFFTSRGYAVFQPNYRGSTGYSRAISKEDDFEFRKMHDDVTDGVKQLVAQGVVDGQRLAIYGGSFGGYLAVAGAAFEPGMYRCAITFAGVFDWKRLVRQLRSTSGDDQFNYDRLLQKLGDPATQQARFENFSPIMKIADVKCPVFVIHGKLDSTVDYRQSTKLLSELDAHKVPHEKLFFETEFHGFSDRKNRLKFLEAVEKFLGKHL